MYIDMVRFVLSSVQNNFPNLLKVFIEQESYRTCVSDIVCTQSEPIGCTFSVVCQNNDVADVFAYKLADGSPGFVMFTDAVRDLLYSHPLIFHYEIQSYIGEDYSVSYLEHIRSQYFDLPPVYHDSLTRANAPDAILCENVGNSASWNNLIMNNPQSVTDVSIFLDNLKDFI